MVVEQRLNGFPILEAIPIWCKLETHRICPALLLVRATTAKKRAAKIPMLAMTTNNSTKVNPLLLSACIFWRLLIYG